jgi:sialate O-acetylesterase
MKYFFSILIFIFISFGMPAKANVSLPTLVSDSMILQRNTPIKIWGWASPGEKVSIQLLNKTFKTQTKPNGEWEIIFPSQNTGGPYTMVIKGKNVITIHDIYFGDVWLCSGQSNMVHQLGIHLYTYANELKHTNNSFIRQFAVPVHANLQFADSNTLKSEWHTAQGNNLLQFSAVAFFFAQQLYAKYKVPIGIINASSGGTPIEAWMSISALEKFPDIDQLIQKNKDTAYIHQLEKSIAANNQIIQKNLATDKGISENPKWYQTDYKPINWHNINVPGYWNDQSIPNVHGIVWYRRTIMLPPTMEGQQAQLALGRIVNADEVYMNGKLIGQTGYEYPQRYYNIPAGILKGGNNTIVVKITALQGKGGFVTDKPYYLTNGLDTIQLAGTWQYKVGLALTPNQTHTQYFNAEYQPTALYNGMIAPITPYAIKGVLWYQGESNTGNTKQYAQLLPAFINDWRQKWHNENLPFIIIQLPNFGPIDELPVESGWAQLREVQMNALKIANTALVVTIDLGEWNDIHPSRKKEVGQRAALAAEKLVYGNNNIISSGPIFQAAEIKNDSIIIHFSNVGRGLTTLENQPLNRFSIAGSDKKFVWANAKIEHNTVVVWNKNISHPLYVRYAWADNPMNANLYNVEGLPASPFRTDQ